MKYEDILMYRDLCERRESDETELEKCINELEFKKLEECLLHLDYRTYKTVCKLMTLTYATQRVFENAIDELYHFECKKNTTLAELIDKAELCYKELCQFDEERNNS